MILSKDTQEGVWCHTHKIKVSDKKTVDGNFRVTDPRRQLGRWQL